MWNLWRCGTTRARVHVRGVCVVLSVLKGERKVRDVRNRRLFRSFTFLGTCEGELFRILGTPTKIVGVVQSKENVAANADNTHNTRTFRTILHSCVANNNCCLLEMRGSMTKCSRISTNERQSCQPVVQ